MTDTLFKILFPLMMASELVLMIFFGWCLLHEQEIKEWEIRTFRRRTKKKAKAKENPKPKHEAGYPPACEHDENLLCAYSRNKRCAECEFNRDSKAFTDVINDFFGGD